MMPSINDALSGVGWPVIVGLAWRMSSRLTAIETTVKLLTTNHAAHIQRELAQVKRLLSKKKKLRQGRKK